MHPAAPKGCQYSPRTGGGPDLPPKGCEKAFLVLLGVLPEPAAQAGWGCWNLPGHLALPGRVLPEAPSCSFSKSVPILEEVSPGSPELMGASMLQVLGCGQGLRSLRTVSIRASSCTGKWSGWSTWWKPWLSTLILSFLWLPSYFSIDTF